VNREWDGRINKEATAPHLGKNGPKSARTMPKSPRRRNATAGITAAFLSGFKRLWAQIRRSPSKVAVGQLFEVRRLAGSIQKPRRVCTGSERTDDRGGRA